MVTLSVGLPTSWIVWQLASFASSLDAFRGRSSKCFATATMTLSSDATSSVRRLDIWDTSTRSEQLTSCGNDEISQPVAGGWPVIEVDTSVSTDYERLVCAVQAAMSDASENERA